VSDKKKISAKAIMIDLKAGLTDKELMDKYDLSFQGIQDVFTQLMKANLATQAYFDKRAVQQADSKPSKKKDHICPYCGYSASEEFGKCPSCGQDTSEWLDTVELTKILEGGFK
jgi:rubrerythrin